MIKWWQPKFGDAEKKLVAEVLNSDYINEGSITEKLERTICELTGAKYAVATTSGTIAIFLALKAHGIGHGDEVIVPDITFFATASAANLTGAKVVLADIDSKTITISPEAIVNNITKYTKAIVPVHVTGRGADIDSIKKIADEYNLVVIEDAAEAFMSMRGDKYLGTIGDAGCFSFSPNKLISTGQGGFVVTDNEYIYNKLRELKNHGRRHGGTGGDDIHSYMGYNFRLTDVQAAIGLGQLTYLQERMNRMRAINKIYQRELKGLEQVKLFKFKDEELPLWTDACVERRDELEAYLRERCIDCRKYWLPIHTQAPFKGFYQNRYFPDSLRVSPRALWFPSAFMLTDEEIKIVCHNIKKFYELRE